VSCESENFFDEVLGFGAGDEDGGRDAKGYPVEFRLAGDVLEGFAGEASRNQACKVDRDAAAKAVVEMGE
jgi:hypothetical protein